VNDLNPGDLTDLERAVLAVLGAGLVTSSIAKDPEFRLDYLTAVTVAALRGEAEGAYLTAEGHPTAAIQEQTAAALFDLTDRRVLSVGPVPANPLLNIDGQTTVVVDRSISVNFDDFPAVFDRPLVGRCLDEVLRNPAAYRFIMRKYADSSEVWQRLYKQRP
jgi:hypothetical protein